MGNFGNKSLVRIPVSYIRMSVKKKCPNARTTPPTPSKVKWPTSQFQLYSLAKINHVTFKCSTAEGHKSNGPPVSVIFIGVKFKCSIAEGHCKKCPST